MHLRLSIGKKLILIVAVVALPLAIVLGWSYARWYQVRIDAVMTERRNIAELTRSSFLNFVRELQRTCSSDARAIVSNDYSPVQIDALLGQLHDDYPLAFAAWVDNRGTVLLATEPSLLGLKLKGDPAFTRLIERTAVRGTGGLKEIQGQQGFWITQSVQRLDTGTIGIVGAFVSVVRLREFLLTPGITGGQNLLDPAGRVVLQTAYPGEEVAGSDWSGQPIIRQALRGEVASSTSFVYPGTDQARLIVEVPIKDLGWVAGSSVEAATALADLRRNLAVSIGAAIAIVLAGLLVSVTVGRRIASSLRYVQGRARDVGAGDFDVPIIMGTGDEVEDLAHSLNETRQKLKRTVAGLADLADTGRQLTSSLEFETVRRVTARSARRLFGAISTWVLVPDRHTEELRVLFASGAGSEAFGTLRFARGEGVGSRVFQSGLREVIPDVAEEPAFVAREAAARARLGQSVQLPLTLGDQTAGVLALAWARDAPAALDERELELLEAFAAQVSIALENARLYQERRRGGELGAVLNEINAILNATPEFSGSIAEVVETAFLAVGCEAAAFLRLEHGDAWRVQCARGSLAELEEQAIVGGAGIRAAMVEGGRRPLVVDDVTTDDRFDADKMRRYGLRSFVVAPLRVRDEVGILLFAYQSAPVPFTESEVDFVAKLAASVSLAMENARLYEAERHIADTLQEALLTIPESLPGCVYSTLYRSATELSRVGGDFYDVFEVGGGRVAVLIGDVSGKGLEAASLTSLVKNAVRIFAHEEAGPAEILAKTNDVLTRHSQPRAFVTAFLGIADPSAEDLLYSSAGHPPALMREPSGEVARLSSGSTVLGVFANEPYREVRRPMAPDHLLLLYTDGVIEARNQEQELFGEQRLAALLQQLPPGAHRTGPDQLFRHITEFAGGHLQDDLALLVFALRPPEVPGEGDGISVVHRPESD